MTITISNELKHHRRDLFRAEWNALDPTDPTDLMVRGSMMAEGLADPDLADLIVELQGQARRVCPACGGPR